VKLTYGLVGASIGVLLPIASAILPVGTWLGAPLIVAERVRPVDAIVVLGAGTYDETTLKPDSSYRLLRALQLLKAGHASRLILSGGTHRGTRVSDARVMADVAVALGADPGALILDEVSVSTSQQAEAVARIAGVRRLRSIALVTSPLHSYRASGTFRRTGLEVVSVPVGPGVPAARLTVGEDHIAGRLGVLGVALYEYVAIAAYRMGGRL
jgi:uncharacterized SAM-binding protein YcdF (DUF218 family)